MIFSIILTKYFWNLSCFLIIVLNVFMINSESRLQKSFSRLKINDESLIFILKIKSLSD